MLTATERLEFCKKCEKKTSDLRVGIVCSLTNAKPDFKDSCDDFTLDHAEKIKEESREKLKLEEKEDLRLLPTRILYGILFIVIFIVIAAIKLSIRSAASSY